jgi:CBS domain containing-hemolysin-like protein
LFASAFFASAETALTALGEARVEALIDGGRAGTLKLWRKHPDRVLAALLLGSTLVNVGMGSLVALVADEAGVGRAIALLTGIATLIILLFGEITPKTFAKRHASVFAVLVMPAVAAFCYLLYPLVLLLVQVPRLLSRWAGMDGVVASESVTSEELEYLIELGARQGSIDKVREELLSSVLAFTEVLVKEIMTPRTRVVALGDDASYEDAMHLVTESELSRIPVFHESLDEVVGVLNSKSLLLELKKGKEAAPFHLMKYVKKPFFVPESMKVSRLLTEMQRRKTHLAVVVDEFGGTSGIVTLEDVVEEIVGEIHDESDIEEKKLRVLSDGVILADAQVSIRDLEQHLGVEFPEGGDYETLGGFLTATAGRVPPPGSLVVWGGLSFTVKASDERRVHRVEIARKPAEKAVTSPSMPPVPPAAKVH